MNNGNKKVELQLVNCNHINNQIYNHFLKEKRLQFLVNNLNNNKWEENNKNYNK